VTDETDYMADAPWRGGDPNGELDPQPPDVDPVYEAARADMPEEFDPLKPGRSVCIYQQNTGAKNHPYLCAKDGRYATAAWCANCKRNGWRPTNA
jgi:hypothetical protein